MNEFEPLKGGGQVYEEATHFASRMVAAMDAEDRRTHWQRTYTAKGEREVSWFQDSPQPSLDLITQAAASPEAAIVDLGGGRHASRTPSWSAAFKTSP